MNGGTLDRFTMFNSGENGNESVFVWSRFLFPIVSLNYELLTKAEDEECEYQVNIP